MGPPQQGTSPFGGGDQRRFRGRQLLSGVASAELTSFVNLADPNCAAAGANQASFDASLILAGIEQVSLRSPA